MVSSPINAGELARRPRTIRSAKTTLFTSLAHWMRPTSGP